MRTAQEKTFSSEECSNECSTRAKPARVVQWLDGRHVQYSVSLHMTSQSFSLFMTVKIFLCRGPFIFICRQIPANM